MLPRWHIILGAIFTFIVWFLIPGIAWYNLLLVFFASFLIDFDHYLAAAIKTKNLSLLNAFDYYKKFEIAEKKRVSKGIRQKGDFHIFHTIEFHALIGLIGIFFLPFFYIFLGMFFHSIVDYFWLYYKKSLYVREFFLFNWLKLFYRRS